MVYDDAQGDTRYQPFKLDAGPGGSEPVVMPKECVRLHNGTLPEPGDRCSPAPPTYEARFYSGAARLAGAMRSWPT